MSNYLLHTCCGPCSISCIEKLNKCSKDNVTLFFDNPNIYPEEEREKRRENAHKVAKLYNLPIIDGWTKNIEWQNFISGFEDEKEGGARCSLCFYFNALLTLKKAEELYFDKVGTSLTVSRFKNSKVVLGEFNKAKLQTNSLIEIDNNDFKKQNGFEISCRLSKQYNIYRQNYCGCKYSLNFSKKD